MAKAKAKSKTAKTKSKPKPKTKTPAKVKSIAKKAASAKKPAAKKHAAKAPKKSQAVGNVLSMSAARDRKKATPPAKAADMKSVFTPLDDRVMIERAGKMDRTPGGLYIPDTVSASDRPNQGLVVAVGRGHRDKKGRIRPLDVKLGDTVMFNGYGGSEVKIDGREFLVLREEEIIAVVRS